MNNNNHHNDNNTKLKKIVYKQANQVNYEMISCNQGRMIIKGMLRFPNEMQK